VFHIILRKYSNYCPLQFQSFHMNTQMGSTSRYTIPLYVRYQVTSNFSLKIFNTLRGRAMAQAVSRRLLTAEARVRSRVGSCRICGGQSGTGTGFSPSTSVFSCQFDSTAAPLKWKSRRNLIFITELHNTPCMLRCVRSICCGDLQ
jgi:hypothetical protein